MNSIASTSISGLMSHSTLQNQTFMPVSKIFKNNWPLIREVSKRLFCKWVFVYKISLCIPKNASSLIWYLNSYPEQLLNILIIDAHENQSLSDDYVKTNQDIIEKQIVLGGLRLATTIKQIYGNKVVQQEESSAFLQWADRVISEEGRGYFTSILTKIHNW